MPNIGIIFSIIAGAYRIVSECGMSIVLNHDIGYFEGALNCLPLTPFCIFALQLHFSGSELFQLLLVHLRIFEIQ